jgi:hypothetical protein
VKQSGANMRPVRLVGTAAVCVLAAFGAAFLLARAIDHQGTARAASAPPHPATTRTTTRDTELADQFAPDLVALKRAPHQRRTAPHRHHSKPAHAHSAVTSAPVVSQPTATTPTYTAPAPAPTSSSSTSGSGTSSGGTHHKGSGSGTTTIG